MGLAMRGPVRKGEEHGAVGASFDQLGWAVLVGLAVVCLVKAGHLVLERQTRARYVRSVVRDQYIQLQALTHAHRPAPSVAQLAEPGRELALQRWLIANSLLPEGPQAVVRDLMSLRQSQALSPELQHALARWNDSLSRWATSNYLIRIRGSEQGFRRLLEEGRRRHEEATGFRRIRREYDATAHYLWTTAILTRYIEETPLDPRLPEALYFLGDSYIRFRRVLPSQMQVDRVLHLLTELYPASVWSVRARQSLSEDSRVAQ